MTFISFFQITALSLCLVQFFGFLNFHVSHLNYEKFNLCLQNTLNMSKTIRVYFGVLQEMDRAIAELNAEREIFHEMQEQMRRFMEQMQSSQQFNGSGSSTF